MSSLRHLAQFVGLAAVLLGIASAAAIPVIVKTSTEDLEVIGSKEVMLYPSCRGCASVQLGNGSIWEFRELKRDQTEPLRAIFVVVSQDQTGKILEAWPHKIVGGSGEWEEISLDR